MHGGVVTPAGEVFHLRRRAALKSAAVGEMAAMLNQVQELSVGGVPQAHQGGDHAKNTAPKLDISLSASDLV